MSLELPNPKYGLDGLFCGAVAALLCWGLVMVASASVAVGEKLGDGSMYFFWRQLSFIGVGGIACWAMFCVPTGFWQDQRWWLLLGALLLLLTVAIAGVKVNGARRWLDIAGFFRLQASEPVRLAFIVWLAGHIVKRQVELQTSLAGFLNPLLFLLPILGLFLLEPDLGATVILLAVTFLMLFLGGARLLYVGGLGLLAVAAVSVLVMTVGYRLQRVISFTDPWKDALGSGFQLTQSLIAVGRGEWFGVGLGNSVQKLMYLPEMHTDFIFAILAEEFGLAGVLLLIALFAIVVWRGFRIGHQAEQLDRRFSAYLCYGLAGWLGLQALINMAVNMGALPTKGLTLPLISYGGSSLVTVSLMLGLVLRVDYENRAALALLPKARTRTLSGKAVQSAPTGLRDWLFGLRASLASLRSAKEAA
ncbi:MAG: putative lipid II flippase FtsW [Stagnimonas sp.]|nr:putative lipid II flippase FtsW [Stagnimonas sp.]